MHEKVLPGASREILAVLESLDDPLLQGWTLAGGTGLALQLGHRVSDDFDFFRTDRFDNRRLFDILQKAGDVETLQDERDTFTAIVGLTKLSFFRIADPFLFSGIPYRFFCLADLRDISLMKLIAIAGRGSRKDFLDLYTVLRGGLSIEQLFEWLPERYGQGRFNTYHILKSLTYFEDADREPMPRMLEPFDWKECKAFFVREAHAIVLP